MPKDHGQERFASHKYVDFVALPWVNNTTGNIQNEIIVEEDGLYRWKNLNTPLSFQPYLIEVAKKILLKLDYSYDFTPWEESPYDNLLMCNTLPAAWGTGSRSTSRFPSTGGMDFCTALPHWTVIEFFEQLGYFLDGEFTFDHKHKNCKFSFNKDLINSAGTYEIDKVIDEFTGEITSEDESKYMERANLKYKDCDHELWNIYSCNWFIKNLTSYYTFDTVEQMVNDAEMQEFKKRPTVVVVESDRNGHNTYPLGGNLRNNSKVGYTVFYCKDVKTYFTLHCYGVEDTGYTTGKGVKVYYRLYELIPINIFGEREIEKDNSTTIELGIVPAWIDELDTEKGKCLFLDIPEMGVELDDDYEDRFNSDGSINWSANTSNIIQPTVYKQIKAGDKDSSTEYFDKLYVGFWAGIVSFIKGYPRPIIDRVLMNSDWSSIVLNSFSMRLNEYNSYRKLIHTIEGKHKYTFKFLSDTIPNPRSIFYIRGNKYICHNITCNFKEDGLSKMMKGTFYKIL